IISLFGAIPVIGPDLVIWIQGDYIPSDATLNRMFSLHVIALPFVLVGLVIAHLMALHEVGSNNPDGIEIKKNKDASGKPVDGIPFHPYYTVKDIMGATAFMIVFLGVAFFAPEGGGNFLEAPNFEPADPLQTPEHIVPVWYFGAFYAMLRAVPDKLGGVLVMGSAVAILFVLPWLDRSPVKSIRYKGIIVKTAVMIFAAVFLMLTYLGTKPASDIATLLARIGTIYYFAFFLLMPWYSKLDRTKPVPDRVTDH
ncbi:MAG: cytochrome bc complex cytochrome b subunit, partial [Proteobacteria bacterium]|nr:cytochrome bc complex cytochrome b subunit [Pseudomonadota bacterium]